MNAHQRRISIRAEAKEKNLYTYQIKAMRRLRKIVPKRVVYTLPY